MELSFPWHCWRYDAGAATSRQGTSRWLLSTSLNTLLLWLLLLLVLLLLVPKEKLDLLSSILRRSLVMTRTLFRRSRILNNMVRGKLLSPYQPRLGPHVPHGPHGPGLGSAHGGGA